MSKFKKVIGVLLAVSVLAAAGGCGQQKSSSSSGTSSSTTKLSGNLNIWAWGADEEAQARKDAIEVFIKEHPELKVTYTVIPTADQVWDQKASAALAAGTAGDVMQMSPDYYGMNTKYYEDLNPFVKKDGINLEDVITPGLLDRYYDADGKLEGLPLHTNCFVMAYNKDMFDKFGVAYPKEGWKISELADWGKKFVSGSGSTETYAIAKHWVMDNLMVYAGGGTPYSDDLSTSNMGSDSIVQALTLYQKLIQEKIMPSDTAQKTIPAETLFVSGKAAMYPMGGFEANQVINDAEENGINIAFTSMPCDPNGNEINVQYATGWAMTTTCQNKEAAWTFIKESSFANEEMGKINARVGIPANKNLANTIYAQTKIGDVGFDNTYYTQHISKAHMNPWGGTLASSGNIWTAMVQEVTLNGKDPAEVVKTNAPKIAKEFASYSFNQKK